MRTIKKICKVKIEENKIIIDLKFFERAFIKQSITNNKSLSGVAIRLIAVLLQKLDETVPKEIPNRNELAEKLGVSRTAIINGLAQLEEERFIVRFVDELERIVWADEERGKRHADYCQKVREDEKKKKNYSGKFLINRNYNLTREEYNHEMENVIRKVLMPNFQDVENGYEERLDVLEKEVEMLKRIILKEE